MVVAYWTLSTYYGEIQRSGTNYISHAITFCINGMCKYAHS